MLLTCCNISIQLTKRHYNKMKKIIMRTKIITLLLACHGIVQGQSSRPAATNTREQSGPNWPIQCVELRQQPAVYVEETDPRGKTVKGYRDSTTFIYTRNNQVLVQSWYQVDSAFDDKGRPGFSQLRQRSLVFTKGQKYGSYTDAYRHFYDLKVVAETFLSGEWAFQQQHLYDSIASGACTLKGSRRIGSTDTLMEWYQCINQTDAGTTAAMQLYYTSTAAGSGFSLCPRLDSAKQQRLCRIVYSFTDAGPKNQINSYTISIAMKQVPIAAEDTAAIMAIFRRDKWGQQ
jgi:hypothetical protein